MRGKDLLDAMGEVDNAYVRDAEEAEFKSGRRKRILAGVATAACVCIVVGIGYFMLRNVKDGARNPVDGESSGIQPTPGQGVFESESGESFADYAVVQANYPECVRFPEEISLDGEFSEEMEENYRNTMKKWGDERRERISASGNFKDGLYPFYSATMQEFLVSEEDTNRIYSPLNLYMALSMLTELTDGNSRAQILNLLGAADIGAVRESAAALWTANYCDDGTVTSILANSLWMRQGVQFIPETMKTLADVYHASSFQGQMGSEDFTGAFHSWLNQHTGGLLDGQVENLEMSADTVLELASTIYFSAQWKEKFSKEDTKEDIFYKDGGEIVCDFMHLGNVGACYKGSNFSAIRSELELGGDMWLFLPEETVDVNEVVKNSEVLELIRGHENWENKISALINLALPKFDVVSELDLIEGLEALGLSDIFDAQLADFSPMCENADGMMVSEAKHAARVMVDEDGCVAAGYTIMLIEEGAVISTEEIDFVLNRPFLFAITGADGSVLFIGVVEEP